MSEEAGHDRGADGEGDVAADVVASPVAPPPDDGGAGVDPGAEVMVAGELPQAGEATPAGEDQPVVPVSGDDQSAGFAVVGEDSGVEVTVAGGEPQSTAAKVGQRRALLAAAVVLVLALVAVGVWQFGGGGRDDPAGTVAGDPGQAYLVAGSLPEGFAVFQADQSPREHDDGYEMADTEVVVYGDPAAEDPWSGPVLYTSWSTAPSPDWWEDQDRWEDDTPEWEPVPLGDRDWEVGAEPETSEFGDVLAARYTDGAERVQMVGFGLDRDALLDAAEHTGAGAAVAPGGLPDGFEELARGPLDLMLPYSSLPAGTLGGLFVSFRDGDPEAVRPVLEGDESSLVVVQLPGVNERAVALPHLQLLLNYDEDGDAVSPEMETWDLEVRGEPAVAQRVRGSSVGTRTTSNARGEVVESEVVESDPFEMLTVRWFEPEIDAVVSVSASNVDEDDVLAFADNLRLAEPGEVEALLEEHPPADPVTGEDAVSEAGEVEAVEEFGAEADASIEASAGETGAGGTGPEGEGLPDHGDPVFSVEGEYEGRPWTLEVLSRDEAGDFVELQWGDSGEIGFSLGVGTLENGRASDGWQVPGQDTTPVMGWVPPEAEEVVVADEDGGTYALDLISVDGRDYQVFIGFVPIPDDQAQVTALDAEGDPLPGWPQPIS